MASKKNKSKEKSIDNFSQEEIQVLQIGYNNMLATDPQYSLEVDPLNKYNLSETQKLFIENYCEIKNIPLAAQLSGIDVSEAKKFWGEWNIKSEIQRINFAKIHRQFSVRMMNLDELGGYLTSQILEYNVPVSEKLAPRDKLNAIKMLMELNKMKSEVLSNPKNIITVDTEDILKEMNVDSIQEMINNTKKAEEILTEKSKLIEKIREQNQDLTGEDVASLKLLSIDELHDVIDKINEMEDSDENEQVN